MATVFAARDLELRRDVAVKVLFPHLARSREVVSRFQREARAAAGLDHRHILRVLDVGGGPPPDAEVDPDREVDPPYIVLELVRGASLAQVVGEGAPVMAEVAAAIGVALATALGEAHRAGIIHRDVKPGNLLLADGGRLVLADFGVAHVSEEDSLVTRTGALLGTPAFMSPEQATAGELDARSDLYSMGATLYQLATGSLPVTGGPAKAVAAILAGEVTPPLRRNRAMGPGLARVIERLMQLEPAARYQSAAEVEAALRALLAESGVGEDADAVVAEWAADRAACESRLQPLVLTTTIRRAREAAEAGEGPRALALCDRALALDPGCVEATEIAERVGRRGRGLRVALVAGASLFGLAVVALAGGFWILGEKSPQARAMDAGVVAAAEPEPETETETETETDTRSENSSPLEFSGRVDEHARSASAVNPPVPEKPTPVVRKPAVVEEEAPPPEVKPAPVMDAAPPRAPKTGTLVVTSDAWCELTIDGTSRGRIDRKPLSFELPAGDHMVLCAGGARRWQQTIEIRPGKSTAARAVVVPQIRVKVDVSTATATVAGKVVSDGATIQLPQGGPYKVVIGARSALVHVPGPCTIRDSPQINCY